MIRHRSTVLNHMGRRTDRLAHRLK
ncbi:hypothetical protein [Streptomyces indicus]